MIVKCLENSFRRHAPSRSGRMTGWRLGALACQVLLAWSARADAFYGFDDHYVLTPGVQCTSNGFTISAWVYDPNTKACYRSQSEPGAFLSFEPPEVNVSVGTLISIF